MSGVRYEKVDTAAVLDGKLGDANGTAFEVRERERQRVLDYWPKDLIALAKKHPPPWRLLVDPTAFAEVEAAAVHAYFRDFFANHSRWPSLDDVRRLFGRVSNHRTPGEAEGQGSLL